MEKGEIIFKNGENIHELSKISNDAMEKERYDHLNEISILREEYLDLEVKLNALFQKLNDDELEKLNVLEKEELEEQTENLAQQMDEISEKIKLKEKKFEAGQKEN